MAKKIIISIFSVLLLVNLLVVGFYFISSRDNPPSMTIPFLDALLNTNKENTATVAQASDGRHKIYNNSGATKYLGAGLVTRYVMEQYQIVPLPYGRPFLVSGEEAKKYSEPDYQVYHIQGGEQMHYTVGYFEKVTGMINSKNKILTLDDPQKADTKYEYIIPYEESDLIKNYNVARVGVEDTKKIDLSIPVDVEVNTNPDFDLALWNEIIKKGDVIVVLPALDELGQVIKDDRDTIFVSWIILRRDGGLQNLHLK